MKLYIHARATREHGTGQRTMVIFKINATHYRPVMGHDVYTVHVDDKHDLHSIVNQVDLLVGNDVQVALAAHMIPSKPRKATAFDALKAFGNKRQQFCNDCGDTLTGKDKQGSICSACAWDNLQAFGK